MNVYWDVCSSETFKNSVLFFFIFHLFSSIQKRSDDYTYVCLFCVSHSLLFHFRRRSRNVWKFKRKFYISVYIVNIWPKCGHWLVHSLSLLSMSYVCTYISTNAAWSSCQESVKMRCQEHINSASAYHTKGIDLHTSNSLSNAPHHPALGYLNEWKMITSKDCVRSSLIIKSENWTQTVEN